MGKLAFIFPGQGSQSVGMGKDLYDNFEEAKAIFDKADDVLCRSISKICFEGPEEDLKQTTNTQPAILTTSIAALKAFEAQSGLKPDFVAGHSLGEYGALFTAGVLSLEDTFKLIEKRASLMGQTKGGAMAAVLGLDDEVVKNTLAEVKDAIYVAVCDTLEECIQREKQSDYVAVANYNCPGQVVITGTEKGISKATKLLLAAGVKRVLPLAVSGAFHSELMKGASEEFAKYLADFSLNDAQVPVLTNVDANITTSAADFRLKMPQQIYSSVYWTQSVQKMIEQGVDTFVEIGPGKVLAGLVKKINADVKVYNIYDKTSLERGLDD